MFKEQFNSLYVAVMDFILNENNNPNFATAEQEIIYYHGIVDEYRVINFNLEAIKLQLNTTDTLYNDVVELLSRLNLTFDKYKAKSAVVRAYLLELDAITTKTTFAERLYRFEQSLVATPLIKVEADEIQTLLNYAKDYTNKSTSFYYFANNPYQMDIELGMLIPTKYTFDTAEKLLTSLYNYAYGLYNTYINTNKAELDSMVLTENAIQEKCYGFLDLLNISKKNKYYASFSTTPEEYFTEVEKIKAAFLVYHASIIAMGVYRFTKQAKFFESIYNDVESFMSEYFSNVLYISHVEGVEYDKKLNMLSIHLQLLEDGIIQSDQSYVVTDLTLKEIVDDVITLARKINRKIIYTQKYHESGIPKTLEFEFYQTELFLTSIKTYYYQLMSQNIYRYSNLGLSDFGDSSIDDIRNSYQDALGKYYAIVGQEINYMNDFEFVEYYNKIIQIQNYLKTQSAIFFDSAIKTSPVTYIPIMEQMYSGFLEQLKQDLITIQNQRTISLIEIVDPNKIAAKNKVTDVQNHVEKIGKVLDVANKYVFLGLNDYITVGLYNPFNDLFIELRDLYNDEKYIKTLTIYDDFFKNNIYDFNLLHAVEKFSDSVEYIFSLIDVIDSIYIDEQVSGKATTTYDDEISIMDDLFDDETYKVSRNELFVELDIMYEFIIANRPLEGTFLTNEKNLKKLYFDNQFMKINYIRWYHKVLTFSNIYTTLDKQLLLENTWYLANKTFIETFGYKSRLETLILSQNKTLSEITKMIIDYSADTNYTTVNLSSDIIRNIETYNISAKIDIDKYASVIEKLKRINLIVEIDKSRESLEISHKSQWVDIITNNKIIAPEEVSYNEMSVIEGNIPLTVELSAKMETIVDATGTNIDATFTWYIGTVIKTGSKIVHTFYEEGTQTVRCEISYSTGEKTSKFVEFNLGGPQNSQIVKSGLTSYSPLEVMQTQPKLTYLNGDGILVTVMLTVDGDIDAMIGDGSITISNSGDMSIDKTGLVILGFEGTEFAGNPFDYTTIFNTDFEMPTEAEFMFDFHTSTPIAGTATIDITNSAFTNFMAKLPKDILSVYEIDKASVYQSIGNTASIAVGDRLVFGNTYKRYAIVEIKNITTITTPTDGRYEYQIDFTFFVNTSLNQYDRDVFKPKVSNMVIPTIVFKTDVREMFNSLIVRLEEINNLKDQLASVSDAESIAVLNMQIAALEAENTTFYLFEELDKIKAKYYALNSLFTEIDTRYTFDFDVDLDILDAHISDYKQHIDNTKTFDEYMHSINAYEFRKNLVDLKILVDLYKDQQTILELIIATYEYKDHDADYYITRLSDIKLFDLTNIINSNMSYSDLLVRLVTELRSLLFKLKIIINFPIMSEGRHIIFSEIYYRLKQDPVTGIWREEAENDFFMLNKKLELTYGYESQKVEAGAPYKSFIEDVVKAEKDLFGKGLSSVDIGNISNYIQVVEEKALNEYDDFFMIPFWIDYLKKNV